MVGRNDQHGLLAEFEDAAGLGTVIGLEGCRSAGLADDDAIHGPFPGRVEDGRRGLLPARGRRGSAGRGFEFAVQGKVGADVDCAQPSAQPIARSIATRTAAWESGESSPASRMHSITVLTSGRATGCLRDAGGWRPLIPPAQGDNSRWAGVSCSQRSQRFSRDRSRRRVRAISASIRRTASPAAAVRTPACSAARKHAAADSMAAFPVDPRGREVEVIFPGPSWSGAAAHQFRQGCERVHGLVHAACMHVGRQHDLTFGDGAGEIRYGVGDVTRRHGQHR